MIIYFYYYDFVILNENFKKINLQKTKLNLILLRQIYCEFYLKAFLSSQTHFLLIVNFINYTCFLFLSFSGYLN